MQNAMIKLAPAESNILPSPPCRSAPELLPCGEVGVSSLAQSGDQSTTDREDLKGSTSADPVLCAHCGRTAKNGISCLGMCVADSGY